MKRSFTWFPSYFFCFVPLSSTIWAFVDLSEHFHFSLIQFFFFLFCVKFCCAFFSSQNVRKMTRRPFLVAHECEKRVPIMLLYSFSSRIFCVNQIHFFYLNYYYTCICACLFSFNFNLFISFASFFSLFLFLFHLFISPNWYLFSILVVSIYFKFWCIYFSVFAKFRFCFISISSFVRCCFFSASFEFSFLFFFFCVFFL